MRVTSSVSTTSTSHLIKTSQHINIMVLNQAAVAVVEIPAVSRQDSKTQD